MPAQVVVYSTEYCPYCTRAKALLVRKRVAFQEVPVGARPDLRRWLVSASGQSTVPQVFINGQPVGGFTDLSALDRRGDLDRLLAEAAPPATPPLPR